MSDPSGPKTGVHKSATTSWRSLFDALQQGLLRRWATGPQARTALARYRHAGLLTRLEQRMRLSICPFEEVLQRVPPAGRVLDLGCGFGMLAHLLALESGARQVIGIEQMAHRVAVAKLAASGLENLRFIQGDIHLVEFGQVDCLVMNDVLHHIPHDRQIPLLRKCREQLTPAGLLLIKDIMKAPLAKYLWNYTHDFLRNGSLPFYCLDQAILGAVLHLVGFTVETIRLDQGYPYPHVLYICTKGQE